MDELAVIGRARRLVSRAEAPPVDVVALATVHGITLKESENLLPDEAGRTFQKGGTTFVVVNAKDDPYRRRFTVLHELAHHVLDLPSRHGERVPTSELERFTGRPVEEKLCDLFAAECLVPAHLLAPLIDEVDFSVETILRLSQLFQASKQCIASSFARTSKETVAYVFAENGRVQHVIASASLRTAGVYVQPVSLPRNSAAAAALAASKPAAAAELDGTDWSSNDAASHYACREEAIHARGWNQTLSLLTFERVTPLQGAASHNDDDELLAPLTGHLPWPKK